MALPVEQLVILRDALSRSIYQGVRSVTIDGMVTQYASIDDMLKARSILDSDIARLTPSTVPAGYTVGQFSKDGRGNQ